jgi:predicted enzyme related to lactoylglutathione lyase
LAMAALSQRKCREGIIVVSLTGKGSSQMSMKIAAVRLFVEDVAAAQVFYAEQLGLNSVSADQAVLVFDAGPLPIVELADDEARSEGLVGRFAGVSLGTSDIEGLHAKLKADGCTIVGRPERQPWGGTLMHVKDPSGNVLSFVQQS